MKKVFYWLCTSAVPFFAGFMFALFLVVATNMAHASGKLMVQENRFFNTHKYRPQVGIAIYQPMFGPFAYNSYTGYGTQDFEVKPDANWYVTKHDFEMNLGALMVGAGVTVRYVKPSEEFNNDAHIKAALKLW